VANPTSRGRGAGSPARRTMTAAARAAAKRTQRGEPAHRGERVERAAGAAGARRDPGARSPARPADDDAVLRPKRQQSGPTVLIEVPDGWEDPPEPSEEFAEAVAAESAGADPDETAAETGASRAAGRSWRKVRTAVLAALLVAGLVAAAVLGWQYREGRQAGQAREQALAAARKAAPVVLSYDYRHLDRDFARARTHLTGKFSDEYRKTTKAVVGPTARKYHGIVKATVVAPAGGGAPAASVVSASPDRAVVLLFVNQVTKSTQVTGSRVDLNRVRMTLTRTSEGWKVSAVDAL
jgi:Mce-associated membrane protein